MRVFAVFFYLNGLASCAPGPPQTLELQGVSGLHKRCLYGNEAFLLLPLPSGVRYQTKKYRSGNGTVIHADVNGGFNIGRKVLPNSFGQLKTIVGRNSGCVVAHPRRINLNITRVREVSKVLPFKAPDLKDMSGSAYI